MQQLVSFTLWCPTSTARDLHSLMSQSYDTWFLLARDKIPDLLFVNSDLLWPKQLLVTLSYLRATVWDLHSLMSLCSNIRYLTSYVIASYSIGIVNTYVPKLKQYDPFIIFSKSCPKAASGPVYHESSTAKSHVYQMCSSPCNGVYRCVSRTVLTQTSLGMELWLLATVGAISP